MVKTVAISASGKQILALPKNEDITKNYIGIYMVYNKINHKAYIGSSAHIKHRWATHKRTLNGNSNGSIPLFNAGKKYGANNFSFYLICWADTSIMAPYEAKCFLKNAEQYWIDFYQTSDKQFGYNIRKYAESNYELKHSKESIEKIRIASTGRKLSEKTKEKIRQSKIGKKINLSEESREKIRNAARNNKYTLGRKRPESERIAISKNFGKFSEDEVRLIRGSNLSEINLGIIFGVNRATIGKIKRREHYFWVTEEL